MIGAPELTTLGGIAIKGGVILLAAGGIVLCLRRAPAALRHFVWVTAMTGLLCVPLLSLVVPAWRIPVTIERAAPVETETHLEPEAGNAPAARPLARAERNAPRRPDVSSAAAVVPKPTTQPSGTIFEWRAVWAYTSR